jgi:hypothetical protein
LQERYEKAVKAFRIYIFSYLGSLEVRQKREGVARDYYDYLLALKRNGDMEEFEKVLTELVNEIPNEPGNQLWKAKAKAINKE